jgi:hypothetical protein
LVQVALTVTLPLRREGARANYLSKNTQSLAIELVSVNGNGVTGVNAVTLNTVPNARRCAESGANLVCKATILGSPGRDVFAVTTYGGVDGTGDVLSVGTAESNISGAGAGFGISNALSLSIDGVIASLKLGVSPEGAKRGQRATAAISLDAFDATGAEIVGASKYYDGITLSIQGDSVKAFALHDGGKSGSTLTIEKPVSGLTLAYDGNDQAGSVSLQAAVGGPSSVTTTANFSLHGKQPPPPIGTIYALNLGGNDGRGATVTEYDGTANGNAAPQRSLSLDSKLYARSIAVDAQGNLYVGYLDNEFGFSPQNGTPDARNEIAIYALGASGSDQPKAVLQADKKTKTTLFPLYIVFDSSGSLVTYGATDVDGNAGDAVLTYAAGSSGSTAPEHGWQFDAPQIRYAGPSGLALDGSGNFYVNGSLYTSLGPSYGLFVNSAADAGDPSATPARTIPWDSTTELEPGLTTGVALEASGEILVGNTVSQGSGSSTTCQARVNVFAAGASGGTTNDPPLRVLTLDGVFTNNPECVSSRDPLVPFFPAITAYSSEVWIADDFNNAVAEFSADARGTVKPSLRIAGSATQLDAPIALVITSASGRAKARPAYPFHALHANEGNPHEKEPGHLGLDRRSGADSERV